MEPEYYDRQAAAQLRKVGDEMAKRAGFEKQAADLDEKALRDDAAAASATSQSSRKSKQRNADSNRRQAADRRRKAAAASKAAATAQASATRYQQKASDERLRQAKKAQQQADRDARAAARAARLQESQEAARLRAVSADVAALSAKTDSLAEKIATSRLGAPPAITVLFMAGTPDGGSLPLRIDREAREVDMKVRVAEFRDQINIAWTQATQVRDILDALNRYRPDVVHFSGHGGSGELLFEGRDGEPEALHGDELALLLQAAPKPIKLVVFNACNSSDQALAATQWADFAIGMDRSIDDDAAKEWAGQFYGSLAAGTTLRVAFQQASAQATVLTSAEAAGQPQLHERHGADAAAVVLVAPRAAA
jgi:hypothetical protein